ncbi:MAG: F0F1 ATP synthase subunit B [Actinomycetota bacterium]|nr:F0F1 ATP synthase subunit B [Actinomycetota bacterium]
MSPGLVLAQEEGGGSLIDVVPGLMVWTIVTFVIVLFVLRRVAYSRVQGLIDERRERIRQALDEADKAREEARQLRELSKREREEAKAERERILDEARRLGQQALAQAREEAQRDLERRLEENQRSLEAESRRLREQIRRDVVELTLLASEKVTRKALTAEDQRRLIDETLTEIDVSELARGNGGR